MGDPAPIVRPFLERGLAGDWRRVVLLSSSATEPGDHGLGALHRLVSDMVPEWVVLRPSWFMENFISDHPVAAGLRAGEVTTATGDGRIGFVDVANIASVATHLLLQDDPPNDDYVITGPQALSYADVCDLVTELTGRPTRHVTVSTTARSPPRVCPPNSPPSSPTWTRPSATAPRTGSPTPCLASPVIRPDP